MQALSSQLIDEIFHIRTCAMKSLHQSDCSNFFVHPQWGPRHTPAIRGKIRPEKRPYIVKDCWWIIVSIRPYFFVAWAEHRILMIFLCTLFVRPPRWTSSSSIELLALCAFKRCAVRACHCHSRTLFPIQCKAGYTYTKAILTKRLMAFVGITTTITSMLWYKGMTCVLLRKSLDFPSTCSSESDQNQVPAKSKN